MLVAAVTLLAGCATRHVAHTATTEERAASFAAFAALRVSGQPLEDFLVQRSAVLVGGAQIAFDVSAAGPKAVSYRVVGPHHFGISTATAVDRRGYFLTTAHSITAGPLYLVYSTGEGLRVAEPRVVWRGDPDAGPDLALLCIDRPVERVFEWADGFRANDGVVEVGPNFETPLSFAIDCFGGRAVQTVRRAFRDGEVNGSILLHTAPGHPGDSGGPLATKDGRLLAIAVGGLNRFNPWRMSFENLHRAHRPDLGWLRRTIERDFAGAR